MTGSRLTVRLSGGNRAGKRGQLNRGVAVGWKEPRWNRQRRNNPGGRDPGGWASRVGEDTTFGKIIELVEQAQDSKSKAQRVIDKFAKYYTPLVMVMALVFGPADQGRRVGDHGSGSRLPGGLGDRGAGFQPWPE